MYEVLKKFEGPEGKVFRPGELVNASEWRLKTQLVGHRYIALTDRSPTPPSPVLKVEATATVEPVVAEKVIPDVVVLKEEPKVTLKVKLQAVGKKTTKRGRPPLGKKGRGSKEVNK